MTHFSQLKTERLPYERSSFVVLKITVMKNTFRILFFIRKDRINTSGKAPVHVRLTIDGASCQFSTKSEVSVKLWDQKASRAQGRSQEAAQLNSYLDFFKTKLIESYQTISKQADPITPDIVRDKFMGKEEKSNTLLSLFSDFIEKQNKLVGIDITQSTFNKYSLTYRRLQEFLTETMNRKDIPVCCVDHDFIYRFHIYLKVDKKLSINSSEKLMRILKRITTFAFKTGLTQNDPFALYTIKKEKTNRGFLTEEEFAKFYRFQTSNTRLQRVRDIFVFACLTGMDYSTLSALKDENIVKRQSGTFIVTPRVKTHEVSQIKLLPQALELLNKFKLLQNGPQIVPMISNGKYNCYLKELAGLLGISKRVTSHLARHTFATTITYANGVSLGSIQKMLGHAKRSTTEIYAEMLDKTVEKEMDQLETVLNF